MGAVPIIVDDFVGFMLQASSHNEFWIRTGLSKRLTHRKTSLGKNVVLKFKKNNVCEASSLVCEAGKLAVCRYTEDGNDLSFTRRHTPAARHHIHVFARRA